MSEVRDILGAVVTRVPLLIARIGTSSLKLLFGSRRAAWSFKRALRKGGMSRRRAGQLARRYRSQVDMLQIVRRILRERPWKEGARGRSKGGFPFRTG
ncbi:MAG: hypothetical protein ACE5KQ_03780 [Thermoplasmata archaeon]